MCDDKNTACARSLAVHRLAERDLHQRIEAARRFVEDRQVGSGRERVHQLDLLAIALRQRPHLLRGLDLEPLDQHLSVRKIDSAMHPSKELECLLSRELRSQRRLARDISDALVRAHGITPSVGTEEQRRPARRATTERARDTTSRKREGVTANQHGTDTLSTPRTADSYALTVEVTSSARVRGPSRPCRRARGALRRQHRL